MSNKTSISPFTLDSYGTRVKRAKSIYKPDNLYARQLTNYLAILVFFSIDLFCLATVWNLVQLDSPFYAWSVAVGCALALDVPLAIGAIALKKHHHGLMDKKEAMITLVLSVIVFAIAFVFSIGFRLVTKDLTFDVGTTSTLINTAGVNEASNENNTTIWFAALFNGVVPLLTSISSFVVSYFSTNPVNDKLKTLETERITLQANLLEADMALSQADDAITHCNGLLAREKDLYKEFIEKLNSENQSLKQLARIILMEKLGNSNDVTALTESGVKVYNELKHLEEPGGELESFIGNHFINKDNIINTTNKLVA